MWIRRPVSRVLCRPLAETRRSFLWTAPRGTVLATYPEPSGRRRPYPFRGAGSLFGLAPGGACHAALVTKVPVRSYRTLSPLPWPRPRRSALCGAIPGVTPGGRYPPPCRRGARTFLDPLAETATAQPSDPRRPWSLAPPGSTGYRIHTSANRHRCCAATELLSPGATRREGEGWERAGS